MPPTKRSPLAPEARRINAELLSRLGGEVRSGRRRRRLIQRQLAGRVGLSRSTISRVERGLGGGLTLDTWQRVALALGRPLRVEIGRDPAEEPADAGHLRLQELLLRLARSNGIAGAFELPTRPADPRHSVDVCLQDARERRLVIAEAWNGLDDIGRAARSTHRKIAEARDLAAVAGGDQGPYGVHAVWVLRATARNRRLVATYPEVFARLMPGSSRGWVRALTLGVAPPDAPGLVWSDIACTRLFEWRRP